MLLYSVSNFIHQSFVLLNILHFLVFSLSDLFHHISCHKPYLSDLFYMIFCQYFLYHSWKFFPNFKTSLSSVNLSSSFSPIFFSLSCCVIFSAYNIFFPYYLFCPLLSVQLFLCQMSNDILYHFFTGFFNCCLTIFHIVVLFIFVTFFLVFLSIIIGHFLKKDPVNV